MIVVPDASVAIKWFVSEDPATDRAAEALLADIVEGRARAVVPELFFYEVFSVLLRRLGDADAAARGLNLLFRLGIKRLALDDGTVGKAAGIASDHGLTGYDAVYAALASMLEGRWATFDAEAHRRIAALGVSFIPSSGGA